MAVSKSKSRSVLGDNPLSQGIFSKTQTETPTQPPEPKNQESRIENQESRIENQEPRIENQEPRIENQESRIENQESRIENQESRFLEKGEREAVNLRLPIELNDWLNELLKVGKRRHGSKIPKEVWVQAALELFKAMPVNWEEIDSEESLRQTLLNLESRIKNL
jgi:predicted RNase H-like nuclease (RuvC/YqgF family)